MKATCSENKLLTNYSKGLQNSSFSCLQTDLVVWYQSQDMKQKHGVKDNPKYQITKEHLCILHFWLPV